METEWSLSRGLAVTNILVGWLLIIGSCFAILLIVSATANTAPVLVLKGLGIPVFIALIILGHALVLYGESVKVMTDIERNTRHTAFAIERLIERVSQSSGPARSQSSVVVRPAATSENTRV